MPVPQRSCRGCNGGALDPSFLIAAGDRDRAWLEPVVGGELEQCGIEADRLADTLEHGAAKIIVEDYAGDARKRFERRSGSSRKPARVPVDPSRPKHASSELTCVAAGRRALLRGCRAGAGARVGERSRKWILVNHRAMRSRYWVSSTISGSICLIAGWEFGPFQKSPHEAVVRRQGGRC